MSDSNSKNNSDSGSKVALSTLVSDAFKPSPYLSCTRESFMWGIATGTAMGVHRYRMGSRLRTVSNAAFGTCFLVAVPSYYFCYKTKILRKEMIESMMAANEFEPGYKAPDQPLLDDHPFLRRRSEGEETLDKEYTTYIKPQKYPNPPSHSK